MFDSMIAYDDLVARLQSWRVRNGLPVTAPAAPHPSPAAAPVAAPDDIPAEQLEVIDDDYYHRNQDFTLDTISSDESTPIGGAPQPPRRR